MNLQVNYGALADDADVWDDVSGELATAAGGVYALALADPAFPQVPGTPMLSPTYAGLQHKIRHLLDQGATQTGGIADRLRFARDQFESTDEDRQAAFTQLWQPATGEGA
jgi:hypothetical protein